VIRRFYLAFLLCGLLPFGSVYGQSSDHFDSGALKGFTKSNIEHIIVEIGPPFKVRDVHGSILVSANNQPLAGSLFAIRDQSGTIRSATADKAGHFQIRGVLDGNMRL